MRTLPVKLGGLVAAAALVGGGCFGNIGGDGPGGDPGPDANGFSCDETLGPTPTPLRRLSRAQYLNALHALTASFFDGATSDTIVAALENDVLRMPPDSTLDDYATQDQQVSQAHTDGYWYIANALARQLTLSSERLTILAGGCATDADGANDAGCVADFVARFGRLALRRPLEDDEVEFYAGDAYRDTASVTPESFAERITLLLQAPQFVFRIEDGAEASPDDGNLFPLTAHELAARLALHFWHSLPDAELLEAADSGALASEEGYAAQVERLYRDPRSRSAIGALLRGWLDLDDLPSFEGLAERTDFAAFAGSVVADDTLRAAMQQEILDLFDHYAFDVDGSFDDVLTSRLSFAKDPALAAIYGVEATSGGDPPAFPDADRAGLLGRAALLMVASTRTHPILKGVFVRRRILCDELPDPPANAGLEQPTPADLMTAREWAEAKTQQAGTQCATCHSNINPLGFVIEGFDALGRARGEERIYDADGTVLATFPVDTRASVEVVANQPRDLDGLVALNGAIVESGKAHACMARHYFRYTWGRMEDPEADGCQLRQSRDLLAQGRLSEVLKAIALHPSFKLRRRVSE
jgi:hypothetical protein